MKEISRTQLPALPKEEIEALLFSASRNILILASPIKIIAFGSSVSGKFDEASDLDFVVVFPDPASAKKGSSILHRSGIVPGRSVDYLCVDEETFNRKSRVGGVFWIAANEGRVLYPKPIHIIGSQSLG